MSPWRPRRLYVPWLVWATLCVLAMIAWPGEETVPYHLGYTGLALAFGLDIWSNRRAYLALAGFTIATGAVLAERAAAGVIAWEETAEIPLMCLLMALVVWHVGRRHAALARVTSMAEREREHAVRRERMVRLTSHEMRTPLAIATGYVDLLRADAVDGRQAEDLAVVHDEMDRIARGCERLLRMIRFHAETPVDPTDVDDLVEDLVLRWSVVAPREWRADTRCGVVDCSADRIRACLDTLVENAVRYTEAGQPIRVFARRLGADVAIGVADAGSGLGPEQTVAVNSRDEVAPDALPTDARSRTGLGLSLVREVVEARGGRIEASRAPEGGAMLTMHFPAGEVEDRGVAVTRMPRLPAGGVGGRPVRARQVVPH